MGNVILSRGKSSAEKARAKSGRSRVMPWRRLLLLLVLLPVCGAVSWLHWSCPDPSGVRGRLLGAPGLRAARPGSPPSRRHTATHVASCSLPAPSRKPKQRNFSWLLMHVNIYTHYLKAEQLFCAFSRSQPLPPSARPDEQPQRAAPCWARALLGLHPSAPGRPWQLSWQRSPRRARLFSVSHLQLFQHVPAPWQKTAPGLLERCARAAGASLHQNLPSFGDAAPASAAVVEMCVSGWRKRRPFLHVAVPGTSLSV